MSLEKERQMSVMHTFTPKLIRNAKYVNRSQSNFYDRLKEYQYSHKTSYKYSKGMKMKRLTEENHKLDNSSIVRRSVRSYNNTEITQPMNGKDRIDKLHNFYKEKLKNVKKIEERYREVILNIKFPGTRMYIQA